MAKPCFNQNHRTEKHDRKMVMTMKKMLMLSKLYEEGRNLLQGKVDIVEAFCNNVSEAEPLLDQADGLFLGNQKLDGEVLRRHPNIRFVAKQGSGVDNIDLKTATELNIPVVISDGANARAVAEHVMMLILAANRRLPVYYSGVKEGNFGIRSTCQSHELQGKTLGLIGFGRIGKSVGTYAAAFGMKIAVYDPWVIPDVVRSEGYLHCETLPELLHISDTVSIHVPLTEETRGMIGRNEIEQMKKEAVLVNCSRGGIVDENALYEALSTGRLFAAGLDVFAEEPASPDNPLFMLGNVVVTPHCAALTKESSNLMSRKTAEGILAVAAGEKWQGVANPEVFR